MILCTGSKGVFVSNKGNKKYLIPIIIGICVGTVGLILLILGLIAYVPGMGDNGWFEASSKRGFFIAFGIFLTAGGFLGGTFLSLGIKADSPESRAKRMMKAKETINRVNEILKENGIDFNKDKNRYCEYCGAKVSSKEDKCSACGARIKKVI